MRHVSLALLLGVALAVLAAPAHAERPALERLIPADCYLLVKLPDLTKSREGFKQTGFGKLLAEPEVEAFVKSLFDPLQDKIADAKKMASKEIGAPVDDVLKLFAGEISVALWKPAAPAGQGGPPVAGMATLEYGENAALINTLVAKIAKSNGAEIQTKDYKGTKLLIVPPKGGAGMPMAFALHQGRLLFSPLPNALERAIDLGAGDGAGTLASAARYAAVSKAHASKDGIENFRLYVDVAALKATFWEQAPPPVKAVMTALEVDRWDSLSYTNRFADGVVTDTVHIATDSRGGLAGVMAPGPLEADGLKVRADNLSYTAGTFDLAALYKAGIAAVAAADPNTAEQMEQAIQGFEKDSGFSLDGWLASLGPRFISRTWMPEYGLMPYGCVAIELKDGAAYLKNMQALAKALQLEWVTKDYKGKTVHHWRAPVGELGKPPAAAAPMAAAVMSFYTNMPTHFYIDGNWAYFADMHQTVAEWIDRKDGSVEWRQITVPEGASMVGEAGSPKAMAAFYNTLLPFIGMTEGIIRKLGVPFDARFLPRASTLTKHLSRGGAAVLRTESGITARSQDNVGTTPVVVAVVGVGAAMLLPVLSKVRDKANRSNSKNNLKQLGLALILYRDNQGKAVKYPPHGKMLTTLYTSEVVTWIEVFHCPVSGMSPTEDDLKNHRAEKLGYIETPHPILSHRGASERPIVWDRGLGDQRIVLFLDGHVEEMSEFEFQALMKKLETRVARLKKEGKKPLHMDDE